MRGKNLVKLLRTVDLLSRPQGASVKEIQDLLSCDRSTVYRVLDLVQEIGVPAYPEKLLLASEKRWYVDEAFTKKLPNITLPDVGFCLADVMALCIASKSAGIWKGTGTGDNLERALLKLRAFLPEGLDGKLDALDAVFLQGEHAVKDISGAEKHLEKLTAAILARKCCRITYNSFARGEELTFEIQPLYCFERDGGLYAFYRSPRHGTVWTLALERIRTLEVLEERFEFPEDFDPEETLDGAFGLILGDPVDARIRVSARQAPYVKERRWCKDQEITEKEDGEIEIRLRTSGRWDVKRWVLSMGAEAELLEPEDLREEIQAELLQAAGAYQKTS
jgi:predicted DNA-binding transcriptional regulator YafY